ncbi:MAG TPA: ABC transporter permease, partial [Thermoanaerobaculia bacterium]|nr:ABC transporter permease [Thermoanaerobaculia bacterium]
MPEWPRRIWFLVNRRRLARELEREMEAHRAEMPEPARFGNSFRLREQSREAWGWRWLDDLGGDLRHAARTLVRRPAFTLAAILTLALGIGGTTAIFSLLRAVILEPLPYADPSRLVMLWEDGSSVGLPSDINPTPSNYVAWKEQIAAFDGMAALDLGSPSLTGSGEPVRLQGVRVTHDLFDVLGVRPGLGRGFLADEDRAGGARVAILGHALWQSRFGGSPSIVGRSILLDDVPHTVVGVMPAGFDYPARGTEIWTPMALTAEQLAYRTAYVLSVVARLRAGASLAQARDEMAAIALRLNADSPALYKLSAGVVPLRDEVVGEARTAVLLLFSIAACVLLIAAANLANLVLARAVERHRDVAVRIALGAGRGRVFRQVVTEHLVLSATGTALGVLAALQVFESLSHLVPRDLTSATLTMDRGLFVFAAVLCVATTVLLGAVPSRLAWRLGLASTLRQVDARAGGAATAGRARSWLIAGQTAFAVVLLVAAGLMTQTFARLSAVDPGFRGEQVLTLRTELPVPRYADLARRSAFYTGVLDRVLALPGVTSAGFTTGLPLVFPGGGFLIEAEARPQPPNAVANIRLVTPGYLSAMGTTLLAGRLLDGGDREGSEPAAVINQT